MCRQMEFIVQFPIIVENVSAIWLSKHGVRYKEGKRKETDNELDETDTISRGNRPRYSSSRFTAIVTIVIK